MQLKKEKAMNWPARHNNSGLFCVVISGVLTGIGIGIGFRSFLAGLFIGGGIMISICTVALIIELYLTDLLNHLNKQKVDQK